MANELAAPGSLDRWCSPTFKSMEGRGGGGGNVPGRSCTALRPIWTLKPGQIFGGGGGSGRALPFSIILPEILFFKIPSLEAWVILG